MMSVNLDAAYLLCDLVAPELRRRGRGSIVNVSSRAGKRGEPRAAHYAASKGGMNALTVALARELGGHGVRVNAIAPGWIATPLTEGHLADPAVREAVTRETLVGRIGVPEDIAGVALFLVSPLASYVTGQVVHVNGGSYTNT
jgi:NAD(P)-dependent dehydrogenase (short-subunit alcohol dehydrogenase family)